MKNFKPTLESLDLELTAVRNNITNLIENIFKAKKGRKTFDLENEQPLASHDGQTFPVEKVYIVKNEEKEGGKEIVVEGMDNNGVTHTAPLSEIDTDTVWQIANELSNSLFQIKK